MPLCVDCGKTLLEKEYIFCNGCIERQKNNPKIQKLLKESVRLRRLNENK